MDRLSRTAGSNIRSVSTTFFRKRPTLARPGRGAVRAGVHQAWPWTLSARPTKPPLMMFISWQGGPTDRWCIDARGGFWVVDGGIALGDVVRWISRHEGYV